MRRAARRRLLGRVGEDISRARSLLAAAVLSAALGYTVDAAPTLHRSSGAAHAGRVLLGPQAMGPLAFGSGEAGALTILQRLLGAPRSGPTYDNEGGCGTFEVASWPAAEVFFQRGRFDGYQAYGEHGTTYTTARGLLIGDTVTAGRALYGTAFETSSAQGGSWSVTSDAGSLIGYLSGPPVPTGPGDRITSIAAGYLGCPAMTP